MLSFGVGPGDIWWETEHSYYVIVTDESGLSSDRFSISLLENDPKTFTHKMVETVQIERWTVSHWRNWLAGCPPSKVARHCCNSPSLPCLLSIKNTPTYQQHTLTTWCFRLPSEGSFVSWPISWNCTRLHWGTTNPNPLEPLNLIGNGTLHQKKHVWVVGPNMNINTGRHKHSTDPSAFDSVLNVVSPTQHAGRITNNKSLGHCKREIAVWFPTLQKLRAAAGGAGACAKGGCMSLPNAARNRGT